MTARVRVTARASRDFDRILSYLHDQSPSAAARFSSRFFEILDGLADFPLTSRGTDHQRIRYVNTQPFPYLLFLRQREEDVEVVAIRHGARNPKSMPARPR